MFSFENYHKGFLKHINLVKIDMYKCYKWMKRIYDKNTKEAAKSKGEYIRIF